MVVKTHSNLSFSIFPRLGLGSSHKSETVDRPRDAAKRDEDWYIPYNGPYELPKSSPKSERDNWAELVHQEEVDAIMGDTVLLNRYGGAPNSTHLSGPGGPSLAPVDQSAFMRSRARSDVTRQTTSSSNEIDPTRARSPRLRTGLHRLQVPSPAVNGGVGQSPTPLQHFSTAVHPPKRASFFAFGSNRKSQHAHPTARIPYAQTPTSPPSSYPRGMPGEWPSDPARLHPDPFGVYPGENPAPLTSEEDDYYNSYYSTLISSPNARSPGHAKLPRVDTSNLPAKRLSARTGLSDPDSSISSPATYNSPTNNYAPHPYAYTSSSPSLQIPRTTSQTLRHVSSQIHHQPQGSGSSSGHYNHTLHTRFPASIAAANPRAPRRGLDISAHEASLLPLKSSVSTPNLYSASRANAPGPAKKPSPPVAKGIDRWFSAETWCDALLFPRPRFKIKTGVGTQEGSSGRIVSPPSTPISGDQVPVAGTRPQLLPPGGRPRAVSALDGERKERRGLVKSRSAADLLSGPSATVIPLRDVPKPEESLPTAAPNPLEEPEGARDDLALPTPAPSLTQYVVSCFLSLPNFVHWVPSVVPNIHVFITEAFCAEFSQKVKLFNNSASYGKNRLHVRWAISAPGLSLVPVPKPFHMLRPGLATRLREAEPSISLQPVPFWAVNLLPPLSASPHRTILPRDRTPILGHSHMRILTLTHTQVLILILTPTPTHIRIPSPTQTRKSP
ncbi:hypothetical protein BV22DRAFT_93891 [Leucogyrophana mollusca]|uniref:Uncharacterized protein n=1 Tax=Leucogyrophana mollusca TaxID=85980 RepID=A0ACB8BVH4_9AGAM|nr:hypothetical protein BV22DRAFT_93891 [Leucogyrophana mollusca]